MHHPENMARMVVSDFYQIGQGLTKKYQLLRSAYLFASASFAPTIVGITALVTIS